MELQPQEDAPLFDENVIAELIDMDVDLFPITTEEVNEYLYEQTGSNVLVPIYSNDSGEDIVRWSLMIESEELEKWIDALYYSLYYHSNALSKNVTYKSVANMFTDSSRRNALGEYLIRYLGSSSLMGRRAAYGNLKSIAVNELGVSINSFYSVLENFDMVDVLAYDDEYPREKRISALSVAAMSMCSHVERNHMKYNQADVIVTCLTIIRAESVYVNPKEVIDRIVEAHCAVMRWHQLLQCTQRVVLRILEEVDSTWYLFSHFKASILLALRILERT